MLGTSDERRIFRDSYSTSDESLCWTPKIPFRHKFLKTFSSSFFMWYRTVLVNLQAPGWSEGVVRLSVVSIIATRRTIAAATLLGRAFVLFLLFLSVSFFPFRCQIKQTRSRTFFFEKGKNVRDLAALSNPGQRKILGVVTRHSWTKTEENERAPFAWRNEKESLVFRMSHRSFTWVIAKAHCPLSSFVRKVFPHSVQSQVYHLRKPQKSVSLNSRQSTLQVRAIRCEKKEKRTSYCSSSSLPMQASVKFTEVIV